MFDFILDRDGIVNIDVGYTHKIADFQFPEGTIAALHMLRDAGARFSVVTGQSGIARGKYTEEVMHAFHAHMLEELKKHDIAIAAVVFCPHHPDYPPDCDCRKPKTGMLKQVEAKLGSVDWSRAWGMGDKPSDSEMLLTMGGSAVLVRSGPHNNSTGEVYWTDDDPEVKELAKNPRHFVADNVLDAAKTVIENI
jgi:D-glycero-D-manno-heptose 1,7-bisphosphate phosphatase